MPKWKPATIDGKPVRAQFNMPIKFVLQNGNSKEPTKKEKKQAEKAAKKQEKGKK